MVTLRPGQTAYLRRGTYVEGGLDNSLQWTTSGTASAPITIAGYTGEESGVIIKTRIKMEGSYLRLARLVVNRNTHYSNFDRGYTGDVNVWLAGSNDVVDSCEIRNSNMTGIFLNGDGHQIIGNHIHDNGSHGYLDHGIYWETGGSGLIANNVIERNFAFGIQLYPGSDRVIVTENTVVANKLAGVIVSGDGSSTADQNLILNNILAFNGEEGVRTGSTGLATSGNIARNNLLYGNNTSGHGAGDYWTPIPGLSIYDNISSDPWFVDLAGRDYALRAGSPATGRADAPYATLLDYPGRSRAPTPDVGAWEAPSS